MVSLKKLRLLAACLLCAALALVPAACAPAGAEQSALPTAESLAQTLAAEATQLFQLTLVAFQNATPTASLTPAPSAEPTRIPTIARSPTPAQTSTASAGCNRAAAGVPFDVTIPDESPMQPGQRFIKTWRLVNNGTCKWTRLYTLVFFSGNPLGALQSQLLTAEVQPGAQVELSVEMFAPLEMGFYQSNWMLMAPDGELFGLGPNGDAPFWARIQVMEKFTDTPAPTSIATETPTPTPTPTP
ncbi:MAG: NBR1-Ig-like domain-containing protein [Anaerolineaceae bacterium]|jgi:hypothetical protein